MNYFQKINSFLSLAIALVVQVLRPNVQQLASHPNLCSSDSLPKFLKQFLRCSILCYGHFYLRLIFAMVVHYDESVVLLS